jgi:hypothetical protein
MSRKAKEPEEYTLPDRVQQQLGALWQQVTAAQSNVNAYAKALFDILEITPQEWMLAPDNSRFVRKAPPVPPEE